MCLSFFILQLVDLFSLLPQLLFARRPRGEHSESVRDLPFFRAAAVLAPDMPGHKQTIDWGTCKTSQIPSGAAHDESGAGTRRFPKRCAQNLSRAQPALECAASSQPFIHGQRIYKQAGRPHRCAGASKKMHLSEPFWAGWTDYACRLGSYFFPGDCEHLSRHVPPPSRIPRTRTANRLDRSGLRLLWKPRAMQWIAGDNILCFRAVRAAWSLYHVKS